MHAEYDCPWQSASGAQSGTSPSRIEGFRSGPVLFCSLKIIRKILTFYRKRYIMMISKRYQINSASEKRERRGNVNTGGPVFAKSREERDYGRSKIYGRKEA